MALIENKLLLFGGKGGTGKTSIASATSLYAASKGKKTLIMSTDPAHSLSDCFGKQIGNKETKIGSNLEALEIDSASLLKDYKNQYGEIIKQIANEGTFFSKEEIQEFFSLSLPGMDELMALIKVIDILSEDKYDLIILDTAPTGHTIRLLELPELMSAYIKVLDEMRQKHRVMISMATRKYVKDKADKFLEKMYKDIENVRAVLKDPSKTKFIPITIPEAMSMYETERLVKTLEEYAIPIVMIMINRVMNKNCDFCKSRRLSQEKYLEEIRKKFSKYKVKEIPLFPYEIKENKLKNLSKVLFENGKLEQIKEKPLEKELNFDSLKIKQSTKFLLFGGKGGVGKTVVASAVSLHESKNKKTLIFSTDPAHSLSDSFNMKIGDRVTKINKNLYGLEIDAHNLFYNLKMKYKKEVTGFFNTILRSNKGISIDVPYDRKIMIDLFDLSPPGIDEIMALKTMMDLMKENKYDILILDTAPTGHTIRLLELPEIAEAWVKTLRDILDKYPFSMDLEDGLQGILDTIFQIRKLLTDSKKTEFFIVTIPEAMGLLETEDLVKSLRKLKIPVENLVVNKIFPNNKCSFCNLKRTKQIDHIKKFRNLKLKVVGVELFPKEIRGKDLNKLKGGLFINGNKKVP